MSLQRRKGWFALHASWLRRALCGPLLAMSAAVSGDDAVGSREYQLKAAFLYNFTRFVEWPASSFADARSPIVVGAYCDDPFSAVLEKVVKNRAVNGRGIVVKRLHAVAASQATHLSFVCASSDALLAGIEDLVKNHPVLTVGDTDAAAELAVISFQLVDEKVRFEINMAAADRAGLRVSAQLQKLATRIRRAP